MIYKHRLDLIVSAEDQKTANEIAAIITGNDADLQTFTVPLIDASGQVTHYCCSTLSTDQMQAAWKNAIASDLALDIRYAQRDAQTDLLKDTNLPVQKEQPWTFDKVLDSTGLRFKPDEK